MKIKRCFYIIILLLTYGSCNITNDKLIEDSENFVLKEMFFFDASKTRTSDIKSLLIFVIELPNDLYHTSDTNHYLIKNFVLSKNKTEYDSLKYWDHKIDSNNKTVVILTKEIDLFAYAKFKDTLVNVVRDNSVEFELLLAKKKKTIAIRRAKTFRFKYCDKGIFNFNHVQNICD